MSNTEGHAYSTQAPPTAITDSSNYTNFDKWHFSEYPRFNLLVPF